MTETTTKGHTAACVGRAFEMALENGAKSDAEALQWVSVWEADGGLSNYGACTCVPDVRRRPI